MKTTKSLFEGYRIVKKGPTSERSFLLQELSDVTGIEFALLLRNTYHLRDSWGTEILRNILTDTLQYSYEKEWRRWKCAELIRKSKPEKKYDIKKENMAS